MIEDVKLKRSLVGNFLFHVDRVINFTYPENQHNILEALRLMEKIKNEIAEQEENKEKKQKFKQINLL